MKHRLFIGIALPTAQTTLIAKIGKSAVFTKIPLLWEPPEKLHLTLNFLGSIEEEIFSDIQRRLPGWLSGFGPLTLRFNFLESLYRRHEPSFIYLSPAGDVDRLVRLRQSVNLGLADIRLSQPGHFLPHVKIAELPKSDPDTTKLWLNKLTSADFTPLPPFTVNSITVFQSLLSKNGSTYRKIAHFPLE